MATSTPRTGLGSSQATIDTDRTQGFLGDNYFEDDAVTITASGSDIEIAQYQLLGRNDSGKINVLKSAATDGSEYPVGVAANAYTIPDGESITVSICKKGMIDENVIVFDGTDTFDTVIDGRTLRDRIASDTIGITLMASTENTIVDN